MGEPGFHIDAPQISLARVGKGQMLPVAGVCAHSGNSDRPLKKLNVEALGVSVNVNHKTEIRVDHAVNEKPTVNGFRVLLPVLEPVSVQTLDLQLNAKCGNGGTVKACETIALAPPRFEDEITNEVSVSREDAGLIVICMATYEPDEQAFLRQIDSIKNQTYQNWICIVRDDASSVGKRELIKNICASDDRFVFLQGEQNINFYANFEAALYAVPQSAAYVALADQDDYWYPEKLTQLVNAFGSGVELVYSDMRIVDAQSGDAVNSYWQTRRNEYEDASVVFLANTVTGAASLFTRSLLDDALPFPARIGDAFHDHWLACVALSKGRIAYVDKPLYDYMQHGQSVIGHCDHDESPWKNRLGSMSKSLVRKKSLSAVKSALLHLRNASLGVYEYECRRLELMVATLKLRGLDRKESRGAQKLFSGRLLPIFRLLFAHLKIRWRGQTTDDAEIRLAFGYLFKAIDDFRFTFLSSRRV